MDLCEKTKCPLRVNRPQEVKVLHINLYCSCHLQHVWWSYDGGLIS